MSIKSNFLSVLKVDGKRAFFSPWFFSTIGVVCVLYLLSVSNELKIMMGGGNVVYFFMSVNNFNSLMDIMLVISVLPFAMSFCHDWKNRYIRSIQARTTNRAYCWSKLITTFFSSFVAIYAGLLLFILVLSFGHPIDGGVDTVDKSILFSNFIAEGKPMLFLLSLCTIRACAAGMWAVVSLACTAFVPNVFIALTAPLILHKLYIVLQSILSLPQQIYIDYLTEGFISVGDWGQSLLFACGFFVVCSVLLGILFQRRVRKAVANG